MAPHNGSAGARGRFQGDNLLMLAIDTSTDIGTVGLGISGYMCVESYFKTEKGHSGKLMPMVDSLLKKVFVEPEEIELVIAGLGPGTFSGVKVGVATAKSLALGLNVGVVGICSLDVLAAMVQRECDLILSVMDARRDELYVASYKPFGSLPERISGPLCLPADGVASKFLGRDSGSVVVVGYTDPGFLKMLRDAGVDIIGARDATPRARDMIRAGKQLTSRGIPDPSGVEPIYLKSPT